MAAMSQSPSSALTQPPAGQIGLRGWLAKHEAALWLTLMVGLTLATRLPFLGHPAADFDEQLYSLMGQALIDGQLPYVDLWDRKPPGLFALYGALHAAFGPSPLAFQIPALLITLGGGWLCYWLGCRIAPPAAAAMGSALYPLLMALFSSHSGQSEVFYVPLLLLIAALLVKAHRAETTKRAKALLALAMLLGGLALQIKYTVLPVCLIFGLAALAILRVKGVSTLHLLTAATLFALLGFAPTALAALLYGQAGHWDAFVFANFTSARLRTAMPLSITLGQQLTYAAPLAMLAFGGLALSRQTPPQLPRAYAWAWAWLVAAMAGLFMSTTVYVYYYAALVPAVILTALPLFGPAMRFGRVIALSLTAWLLASLNPVGSAISAAQERAQLSEVAWLIQKRIAGNAHGLLIYDGPLALYPMSGATPPGTLVYPDHLNNALEAPALPIAPEAELTAILAARPAIIVTSSKPVTVRNVTTDRQVQQALDADYRLLSTFGFQDRPLEIYGLQQH